MNMDLKEILMNTPDLKQSVKKAPEELYNLNDSIKKIQSELDKIKPMSVLSWRRPTGIRIFARNKDFQTGHLEVDVIRYGNNYFISINNIPREEENILDKGSLGDIFDLYILDTKLRFVNINNDIMEIPIDSEKISLNDFFRDLFLDGTSDSCTLTWRTTMRLISELEKMEISSDIINSVSQFFEKEIESFPFQILFQNNKFIIKDKKTEFKMEVPNLGVPLRNDSLVEFMGFITSLTGNYHSDIKQIENLNKLNNINTTKILDFAQEGKEQALIHTNPEYAKELYEKLSQTKIIEDKESGDILIAVPYSEEELLKLKKKMVKMIKDGVPREELPPIADENRRKLGISNYFVPIILSPIWGGVSLFISDEREQDQILTTRILNQIRRILKTARIYFEETESEINEE
jgi:hypothetical protein